MTRATTRARATQADEARLADNEATYTRAEFIDFYGVAQGEAVCRAAGPQPWGGRLARTSTQLATARGNQKVPSTIVTAARACNQDGSDREKVMARAPPRTHRDADHGGD